MTIRGLGVGGDKYTFICVFLKVGVIIHSARCFIFIQLGYIVRVHGGRWEHWWTWHFGDWWWVLECWRGKWRSYEVGMVWLMKCCGIHLHPDFPNVDVIVHTMQDIFYQHIMLEHSLFHCMVVVRPYQARCLTMKWFHGKTWIYSVISTHIPKTTLRRN